MSAAARLALLLWLVLCQVSTYVFAFPPYSLYTHVVLARTQPDVNTLQNGTIIVVDPATQQFIPQGPATDGSGSDFSTPAMIWIVFCFAIGVPMALAGIRGWRFTTGVGIGLAATVCAWAAIINSVNATGISDFLLTVIVVALGFLGFILGVFEFALFGGMILICITGGLSIGIRVILLKQGLLISSSNAYAVNWVIIALFGFLGGVSVIRQRAAMLLGCSSIGTFLSSLGADLVINKQSGLSQGLRFLFDHNDNHLVDLLQKNYHPTLTTRIILISSLGLTPVLAFAQHKIFAQPFSRNRPLSDTELAINYPTDRRTTFLSGVWDHANGAKMKLVSRFSL